MIVDVIPHAVGDTSLRRSLSFRDLLVYGLLFIAPMAPVGIFGTLYADSRGAVALVYVVATVAMGLTAYSYAQMVRVVPEAGSVFAYARTGLGEGAGFLAGWLLLLDYLFVPAVAYLFSGIAVHALVPGIPVWLWTSAAIVVTSALNMTGVRAAARVGLAVLAAELAVLATFVVAACAALVRDGPARGWLEPFTGSGAFSPGAVLGGVSIAVLSYLGFESIANFAEEVDDRSRHHRTHGERAARALLVALTVAGLLFVLQSYLAALLYPDDYTALVEDPGLRDPAFYDAAEAGVGHWLHNLVALSKAVGAAFSGLAAQAAAARTVYAMAREGRLPRALARLDAGSGVPRRAVVLSAALAAATALWASGHAQGLGRVVAVVNLGALGAFALLHVAVFGLFHVRRAGGAAPHPVKHLLVPLLGLAVCVAVITEAQYEALVVGAVWLAAGLAVLGWRRVRADQ
ncbi:APC family permease [Streptomyces sp. NPDC051940]|uniref:APC family permease n=1 Tax=Streptomyces sp. NPDC051940 TaxID=3155675 RepID=UPI00343BF432